MKRCPACGHIDSDDAVTYCVQCGASLQPAPDLTGSESSAERETVVPLHPPLEKPTPYPGAPPPVFASAPPPIFASAPPPVVGQKNWLAIALLALGIILVSLCVGLFATTSLSAWHEKFLFSAQMLALTLAVCLTPTLSHHLTKRWGWIARALLETFLLTLSFALFYLWLWGKQGLREWLEYTIILILLLEVGGHLVEWNKKKTIARLSRSKLFVNLRSEADAIESMFQYERLIYLPVPLGLILGTVWGVVQGWESKATVYFCLQLVFWGAAIILLVFLIIGFFRMSDPLFDGSELLPAESQISTSAKKSRGRKKFRLKLSPAISEGRGQKALDLAMMVVDLRKVYLFDSAHNVVLLVAFAAAAFGLGHQAPGADKSHHEVVFFVALLIATFAFNHLPYIIGQSRLHEKVLEPYEGIERAEVDSKLKEHAPYFPRWEFLAVMLTSSPAGGVLYFLLEHSVVNILGS